MKTVAAGVLALLLAARLRTREIVVDGRVCGTVHDLWRGGSWESAADSPACLDAAVVPLWAAEASLLAAVGALLVAAVLALRRAPTGRVRVAGAVATWAAAGAAVTTWVLLRLDPGPTCPGIPIGGYDDHQRFVQESTEQGYGVGRCLALGGGFELDAYPFLSAGGALAAAGTGLLVLLVLRRRGRQRTDQRGWVPCATS